MAKNNSKAKSKGISIKLKSCLITTNNVINWLWKQLLKLMEILTKTTQWIITNLGKTIVWIWALVIATILVIAIAFYLIATGLKNIDSTTWNQVVIEKTTPFVDLLVEKNLDEIREKLEINP